MDRRLKEYIKNKEDIFVSSKGSYCGPYAHVPLYLVIELKKKNLVKPVGTCLNGNGRLRLLWQSHDGSLPSIKVLQGVPEGYSSIANFITKNKLKSSDTRKLYRTLEGSSNFLLATYEEKGCLFKIFKEEDLNNILGGEPNSTSSILFKDTDNKKDLFIFCSPTSNEEAAKKLGFNIKRVGSSAVRNYEIVKIFDDGKVKIPLQLWQKKGGPLPKLALPRECPKGYVTKISGHFVGNGYLPTYKVRERLTLNGIKPIYIKRVGRGCSSVIQRCYPIVEVEKAVQQLREQWKEQKISSLLIYNNVNNKKETLISKIKSFWNTLSSKFTPIKSNEVSEDIIKI